MTAAHAVLPWAPPGRRERDAALSVATIRDTAGLLALEGEWNALLAASAADGPFLLFEWLAPWWTHLGGHAKLAVRTVRQDGELLGIAPLAVFPPEPRAGFMTPTLRFLGSGAAGSDYLDLIVRPGTEPAVLDALGADLARVRIPLVLGAMRVAPCLALGLAWRLEARGFRLRDTRWSVCPYADLQGKTWDSYLATLGGEHRYAVRRAARGIQAKFTSSEERISGEAERRDAMAILGTLHERRWRGLKSETAFRTDALRRFHDEASRRLMDAGRLRLDVLRLDGRAVAAIYGIRHRETFHFYQSGFDPAFSPFSVGVVAMAASIRGAIAEGASEYDFLHGAERYKFHWARGLRRLRSLELYPPGRVGRIALSTGRLVRATKAAVRRAVRWARR